jgi:sulfur-oxidizing protein SoxY
MKVRCGPATAAKPFVERQERGGRPADAVHPRRRVTQALALVAASWAMRPCAAPAGDDDFARALATFARGARPVESRVTLSIEPLVDNGNSVPVTVRADLPLAGSHAVTHLALFNERNPQPEVAVFELSPLMGRAEIATRIRLAGTQRVAALARTADGRVYARTVEVVVTTAACAEMD